MNTVPVGRLPLSAHLGYLFTEVPLEERFAAAAQVGFSIIEHPSPYAMEAVGFRALCEDNGLRVAQIALPPGRPGEKGIAARPGRGNEFSESLDIGISYAKEIGCRLIHPMSGVPAENESEADIWNCYVRNLGTACERADRHGLAVIIEPIGNGSLPGYFMQHPNMATRAIETLNAPNLFISFDAYHAQQSGVDPTEFTSHWGEHYAHVQVADAPGRHEPGTAQIDFASFFAKLVELDYAGAVGLEYHPAQSTADGLDWPNLYPMIQPLKRLHPDPFNLGGNR